MLNSKLIDALFPGAPLIRKLSASIGETEVGKAAIKAFTVDELVEYAKRRELESAIAREDARTAQELAIAERITCAAEVEIEEFYDNSVEGKAGLNTDGTTIHLGASGGGRKVTKRVYKFRGFRSEEEVLAALTSE
ncbi:hypothetical protein [Comamonas thiooxydans]|uniref:hypothetical protein n=1 Tax=Comamonas thiooxydans TaxID=363952 RepID=UPI000691BE6A|nr:hypothetical protein [Comamonas thiooxydans]